MRIPGNLLNLLTLIFLSITVNLKAQDTIEKINGTIIYGRILEVGPNTITYKKTNLEDGPIYIDNKTEIAVIRYHNGQKEEITKTVVPQPLPSVLPPTETLPNNNYLKNGPVSEQYRIDRDLNNRFIINGQRVSTRKVDNLLKRSKDPAIQSAFKTAKTVKILQKIVGLTSIPGSITGGIASLITFNNCYKAIKRGTATPNSYINAGLSFIGTVSLPVTSKLLKSKRDKLYDKAIDLYNLRN